MTLHIDLLTISNSIKNAYKKFGKVNLCISEVYHYDRNQYIAKCYYDMTDDEINLLNLTDDNTKDFDFYSYVQDNIPKQLSASKSNKNGIFISHVEIA